MIENENQIKLVEEFQIEQKGGFDQKRLSKLFRWKKKNVCEEKERKGNHLEWNQKYQILVAVHSDANRNASHACMWPRI